MQISLEKFRIIDDLTIHENKLQFKKIIKK